MVLCRLEAQYQKDAAHPRLLKLLDRDISELARSLGFSERQMKSREFRAEKDGSHIVRLILDQ